MSLPPTHVLLLAATFIIAISGLVYELLAGTLSSYLLGDSVYQFSLVIGLFMTAMGIGAYLSRFVQERLEYAFIVTQIALGFIGGTSAPVLFYAFAWLHNYSAFLFLLSLAIGILIGLEIPLITRILQRHQALKINISNVLTADYIGALAAALLFPLVLAPQLGLLRTSLVFGLLNLFVAGMALSLFRVSVKRLGAVIGACALLLACGLVYSNALVNFFERRLYQDEIIFAETTPYQRVIITRGRDRIRMFINGGLQFDSQDEYRYHETLVHPAMSLARRRDKVLVLGGGDGMAVREVLQYAEVKQITLVDLDPTITRLYRDNALLNTLNGKSLHDPRVRIINDDAWKYLEKNQEFHDVMIIDLPDPNNTSLSRLYSRAFYLLATSRLARDGLLVTQATSPLYARKAFWCIYNTLAETPGPYKYGQNLYAQAYHTYIPSFGEWGFVLAGHHRIDWSGIKLPENLRYLNRSMLPALTAFPPDMQAADTEINTLQAHPLLRYYEQGWEKWFP
ncbi:MAG: polyamine aminopropyltransferase [Gammaproteobacteria bacterium]|nr:polyamine aminopropyltransferase [Gammaproteobacteria bacterium]